MSQDHERLDIVLLMAMLSLREQELRGRLHAHDEVREMIYEEDRIRERIAEMELHLRDPEARQGALSLTAQPGIQYEAMLNELYEILRRSVVLKYRINSR